MDDVNLKIFACNLRRALVAPEQCDIPWMLETAARELDRLRILQTAADELDRLRAEVEQLRADRDCTEVNPRKRGGIPVLKGSRFTLAQVLAEIAAGRSVSELAEDFDLDFATIKGFLEGLAVCFDRPPCHPTSPVVAGIEQLDRPGHEDFDRDIIDVRG